MTTPIHLKLIQLGTLAVLLGSEAYSAGGSSPQRGMITCSAVHANADRSITCDLPQILFRSKMVKLDRYVNTKRACEALGHRGWVTYATGSISYTKYLYSDIFGDYYEGTETVGVDEKGNLSYSPKSIRYLATLTCKFSR